MFALRCVVFFFYYFFLPLGQALGFRMAETAVLTSRLAKREHAVF